MHDSEHIASVEGEHNAIELSEPALLLSIELNERPALDRCMAAMARPGRKPSEMSVSASAAGIFNCISYWAELDFPSGDTLRLGPPQRPRARRPAERRARRQRLHFVGYERRLDVGEAVRLTLWMEPTALHVDAPAATAALEDVTRQPLPPQQPPLPPPQPPSPPRQREHRHQQQPPPPEPPPPEPPEPPVGQQRLVPWPQVNLLAYHFPMVHDEGRNGAFDRALRAAVGRFAEEYGRMPRVLDIGSGSGLLAMMAARAGATEVVHAPHRPEARAMRSPPHLVLCATALLRTHMTTDRPVASAGVRGSCTRSRCTALMAPDDD